ncbi:hypothetical protein MLD38_033887 [Melastoma candidum]|uniref:Uncharacterized protein n=1 Tax=Melastoma candidum TaxID=119954 RepID=A0ACB9MC03_9MYRT|nr:hypothetical protein MLD38_033887 [Melastoma candidum]
MSAESREDKRRVRRYSTGSTISRYLGPLPGSCHDFCKYGNGKEARLDTRSVMSRGRTKMKLSGGHGSKEEIHLIGILKDEHQANKMNSATEMRKKAGSSQQPKSKMRSIPASSRGAMKPKGTNTLPRVPSENYGLPAKVKSIMSIGTGKSTGHSIHSTAPHEAQKKNKTEQSKRDNREGVQGEESYSNDGKVESETSESTDYHSTPSFPELRDSGRSCRFSDFTESDGVNTTGEEDEAKVNLSAEDDYGAEKLNFRREKVNGLKSLIQSPRRLKLRRHSDGHENKASGYSSDPGSMKVDLRHWQMQEKEATRLLNDIIEETAAELSRTHKSKVKALVGAFETVISLQDVDPS